jgi:hypothetical protein
VRSMVVVNAIARSVRTGLRSDRPCFIARVCEHRIPDRTDTTATVPRHWTAVLGLSESCGWLRVGRRLRLQHMRTLHLEEPIVASSLPTLNRERHR